MTDQRWLKGGGFQNRYRLRGTLVTESPLHIGSGNRVTRPNLKVDKSRQRGEGADDQLVKISAVMTDHEARPYIPGSSLKGSLRAYLLDVLQSSGAVLARQPDFEVLLKEDATLQEQKGQIQYMKEKASVLERLFGTPFAEGKLEVWDAPCTTGSPKVHPSISDPKRPPYWDARRLTCVDQSVAIDFETHTALDKKLYHYEVVPPGVAFDVSISGQNLSSVELGMLLFGLEAFNSKVWPLTVGAMGGRGLGRMSFKLTGVYCLNRENVSGWVKDAVKDSHAGYGSIKSLEAGETAKYIHDFRAALLEKLGGAL